MGRRIKEREGGKIEMVDVSFLGRLLLLPYVQHTRAQKKLYRTRMSVFCMENKKSSTEMLVGGGKKQPPPFGSFFLLQWNCPAVGIVLVSVARRLLVRFVLMGWHTHSADAENQPTNPVRTHLQQGRCFVYWEKLLRLLLWYLFFHREFVCVCVRKDVNIYLFRSGVCVCASVRGGRRRLGCNHKLSATVKDHLGRRLIDLLLLLFSSWKTVCVYVYVWAAFGIDWHCPKSNKVQPRVRDTTRLLLHCVYIFTPFLFIDLWSCFLFIPK